MADKIEPKTNQEPPVRRSKIAERLANRKSALGDKINKLKSRKSEVDKQKERLSKPAAKEESADIKPPATDEATDTIEIAAASADKESPLVAKASAKKPDPDHSPTDAASVSKDKSTPKSATQAKPSAVAPPPAEINSPDPAKEQAAIPKPVVNFSLNLNDPDVSDCAVLIHKILDKLESKAEFEFLNDYKNKYLELLKSIPDRKLSIYLVSDDKQLIPPAIVKQGNKASLVTLLDKSSPHQAKQAIHQHPLKDLAKCCSLLLCSNWVGTAKLSPQELAQTRNQCDVIFLDPPAAKKRDDLQFIKVLERLCGNTSTQLVAPLDSQEQFTKLFAKAKIHRGYSALQTDRIIYIDSSDYKKFSELLLQADTYKKLALFSLYRNIKVLADGIIDYCSRETGRAAIIAGLKSPKKVESVTQQAKSVFNPGASLVSAIADAKNLLNEQGIRVDEFGKVWIEDSQTNIDDALQAMLSDFSLSALTREDELDVMRYTPEDRKYVNRIKRFRFASKLNFLWKLKPEYLESLHDELLKVITKITRNKYKDVSDTLKHRIKDAKAGIPQDNPDEQQSLSFALDSLDQQWKNEDHLLEAMKKAHTVNRFRTFVFSKRGVSAQADSQKGMFKELRESRMFVSQLMAFGMLAAILFGSGYALEVFVGWVSGSGTGAEGGVGQELTAAAKESRSLGRQVRIIIQAIAGIGIIGFISLRIYLKKAEKVLDKERVIVNYSEQLLETCKNYINDAINLCKGIITIELDQIKPDFEYIQSLLTDGGNEKSGSRLGIGKGESRFSSGGGGTLHKDTEEIKKWFMSLLTERESISILKDMQSSMKDARKELSS